jgi:AcrR family transcriptional regulator
MDTASNPGARTLPSPDELRAQRRAARAADNRADILDAAERAFAERGLDGSLRDIAKLAGFSTAAIYNYFENKQQLFAETLSRRGIELLDVIARSAATADRPMAKLHAIVDGAIEFFETYPDFRRMLRQVREVDSTIPEIIRQQASERIEEFTRSVALMVGIIEDGQAAGEIRNGSASALLHFYMTLVYEHVFLATPENPAPALTREQFHDMVDGALRVTTA